jgi:hypothetical protein
MNTTTQSYLDQAIAEILDPALAVTKQYLAVNEIEFENGQPKVERIDLNHADNLVAVYFPIKGERYFLQVNLSKAPAIQVDFVLIQNGNRVYFTATSEELTQEELAENLAFKPLTGWSKGDFSKNGKTKYQFSRIAFEPLETEACDLGKQLNLLLTQLETDSESIRQLTQKATAYISVCRYQYISANAGIHLGNETIQRLAKLNLSIDIDTYIVGKAIKDEA